MKPCFQLGFWNVRKYLRCRIKQLCLQKAPATEQPFRLSCWILFRNLVALPDPSSARSCLTCTVFLYNQWYKLKQHLQRCQVIFSIHGSFTCWVLLEGNDVKHDSFRPMVKEATLHRTLPAFCEHLLLVIWWFFTPHRPSSTSCKREKSEHLGPSSLVMWSSIFQRLPRISLNSNHLSNQSAIVCFLNSLPPEVCNGGISDKLQCQRLQVVSGGTFPRVRVVAVSKCIRYHEILIRMYHEIHGIYWILICVLVIVLWFQHTL